MTVSDRPALQKLPGSQRYHPLKPGIQSLATIFFKISGTICKNDYYFIRIVTIHRLFYHHYITA